MSSTGSSVYIVLSIDSPVYSVYPLSTVKSLYKVSVCYRDSTVVIGVCYIDCNVY